MTELGSTYNHNGQASTASIESRQIAKEFTNGIAEYNWKVDYFKFCQLLELEPGQYSDDQYRYFQQLAESLTRFNTESLAKMIDAGISE
ncbi:hypothetical protein [Nostoc sp.]|uniref:hypothetical protein n=1 Tax=Nostoc sp. TaxID=1180 RepID=UPI002FF7D8C3